MQNFKRIFAIVGSAGQSSSNEKLVQYIKSQTTDSLHVTIFNELHTLPPFNPDLSHNNPPGSILAFRRLIEQSDGIIISTPEYIFSLPAGLKNAFEWCVATTVFENKPTGLITASADGKLAHDSLLLIMKTLMSKLSPETTLHISSIKGKIDSNGTIKDGSTKEKMDTFIRAFVDLIH